MMNDTLLRKIDLNLLLSFSVLMQERNVSRAAERLLVGQPGLSAALKRLRESLDDELFVRVGRGLQPTPRALAIAPAIEAALSGIEQAIRPPAAFEPTSWAGEFRVGMCDNLETAFFGPLAARLRKAAPLSRLVGIASDTREASRMLDEGSFDFSVSVHGEPASWQVKAPLFEQSLMTIYDPRQVSLEGPLGIDDFARIAHVAVSFAGSAGSDIDAALLRAGYRRSVVASVPRFSSLPAALRSMPVLATIPEAMARCMANLYQLTLTEPPIALSTEPVTMLYRRVDQADSRAKWFRRLFVEVTAETLQNSGCKAGINHAA